MHYGLRQNRTHLCLRRVFSLKFQAGEIAPFIPRRWVARGIGAALGLVPGLMVCPIDGGAGGELPGRLEPTAAKAIRAVESG